MVYHACLSVCFPACVEELMYYYGIAVISTFRGEQSSTVRVVDVGMCVISGSRVPVCMIACVDKNINGV